MIAATLIGKSKVTVERAADLRFVGQGFELVTPLPRGPYTTKSLAGIRAAFLAEYKRIFQQVPPVGEIEIINIRVALTAPIGRAALKVEGGKGAASKALKGKRKAWLADRGKFADMPVYDRYALPVGAGIKGPAIIEEASATMIVPPGARARRPRRQPARRSRQMITLPTESERIVARKDGAIGWMIFNNPAKHNAISMDMAEAVPAVMRDFENDAGIRVIVVAGAGEKAFAAGSDISGFEDCAVRPAEEPALQRRQRAVVQRGIRMQQTDDRDDTRLLHRRRPRLRDELRRALLFRQRGVRGAGRQARPRLRSRRHTALRPRDGA